LFKGYTADGITDPEFAFVLFYQFKHQGIGAQVTLIGNFIQNGAVFLVIFVKMIFS
jgi:hypothetical protein